LLLLLNNYGFGNGTMLELFLWKILKKLTFQCMVFLPEYGLTDKFRIADHIRASQMFCFDHLFYK